jgi:hypothetical protein
MRITGACALWPSECDVSEEWSDHPIGTCSEQRISTHASHERVTRHGLFRYLIELTFFYFTDSSACDVVFGANRMQKGTFV